MGLHAEVALIALLGLAHVGVARLVLVLGRRRGVDDRGAHDRAGGYLHALGLQVPMDLLEQRSPQTLFLEQMPEPAHCGFVRHGFAPQVNADEGPHGSRFVERLFHCRVGQIEPLLQEVDAQQALQSYRWTTLARVRIHRLDQRAQFRPGHDPVHLAQKCRAARRLRVALKPSGAKCHLFHRSVYRRSEEVRSRTHGAFFPTTPFAEIP